MMDMTDFRPAISKCRSAFSERSPSSDQMLAEWRVLVVSTRYVCGRYDEKNRKKT